METHACPRPWAAGKFLFLSYSLINTHREMVYEHTALQKLKSILGSCCHQGGCFIFDEQTQRSRFLFLSFHSSLAECTVTDIEITNIHLYGFSEDKLNFQREILMIETTLLYSCGNAHVWKTAYKITTKCASTICFLFATDPTN